MIWVKEIYIGIADVDPLCAMLFGKLNVDSVSQVYFQSLERSIKSGAYRGIPDIKMDSVLAIFIGFFQIFD